MKEENGSILDKTSNRLNRLLEQKRRIATWKLNTLVGYLERNHQVIPKNIKHHFEQTDKGGDVITNSVEHISNLLNEIYIFTNGVIDLDLTKTITSQIHRLAYLAIEIEDILNKTSDGNNLQLSNLKNLLIVTANSDKDLILLELEMVNGINTYYGITNQLEAINKIILNSDQIKNFNISYHLIRLAKLVSVDPTNTEYLNNIIKLFTQQMTLLHNTYNNVDKTNLHSLKSTLHLISFIPIAKTAINTVPSILNKCNKLLTN